MADNWIVAINYLLEESLGSIAQCQLTAGDGDSGTVPQERNCLTMWVKRRAHRFFGNKKRKANPTGSKVK